MYNIIMYSHQIQTSVEISFNQSNLIQVDKKENKMEYLELG